MPELPEVETMRRSILAATGCRVIRARKCKCLKRPLMMKPSWPTISRRLKNKTITEIGRHGKRLLLSLDEKWTLVIEPRMTGLMLVNDPPTQEHMRFELELDGGKLEQIGFWDQRGLGQVFLFNPDELADYLAPSRIGPDALAITAQELTDNLKPRSLPVKVGLLDQKAIAGVGNIYASEILHLCGIDPRTACKRISVAKWKLIHEKTLSVLHAAIKAEGSTLSDGTYRTALNDPGSYQNQHRVYDRQDQPCPTCHQGRIRRIVQAQRSTYFCPNCQRSN